MNTKRTDRQPTKSTRSRHNEKEHRQAANRAVAVSAVGLAITGGIELVLAFVTGSVALLSDAIHNLSDVSTSAVVFIGFWFSKRNPTTSYQYGFERAEDIAGLGVALVIFASAIFAGLESYQKLVNQAETTHLGVGMIAALLAMVGNLAVSRYKKYVARQIQSLTMEAEANHSWLDTISSLGALIGLIGVAFGFRWADPVAGFAVTLFILHVGYEVTRDIVKHLMDGVETEYVEAAEKAACTVPGISAATVRGRWMGRSLIFEVEGELEETTTLAQADKLRDAVEVAVRDAVEETRQVHWIPRPRHQTRDRKEETPANI